MMRNNAFLTPDPEPNIKQVFNSHCSLASLQSDQPLKSVLKINNPTSSSIPSKLYHTSAQGKNNQQNDNPFFSSNLAIDSAQKHEINEGGRRIRGLGTPESMKPSVVTQPSMIPIISDFQPRSSMPSRLSWMEYARQGILAAYSSRLNPYALHPQEYQLLKPHITRKQITIYLNIRNGILRLWHRNPLVYISKKEAAGCSRDSRHISLALVSFEWLLRNGYINFGCVEVSSSLLKSPSKSKVPKKQRKIVVIGAGVAGLSCARQLEALFTQTEDEFHAQGEQRPKVIILEGRNRIGGRVFSHPLIRQDNNQLGPGKRCTAEMGAQIIIGFDHGNPLSFIIRGQLALEYHKMRDDSVLYDFDGSAVDGDKDRRLELVWNDILERAALYRHKLPTVQTVEGDQSLLKYGEDPKELASDDNSSLEALEATGVHISILDGNPVSLNADLPDKSSTGVEKLGGRQYQLVRSSDAPTACQVATSLGFTLKSTSSENDNIDLSNVANTSDNPSLGAALDEGIFQFQNLVNLTEQDLRLLNWHHANLEYANATNVNNLSLSGWDQDIGNEFEGFHSEIKGGYSQFPRGLWKLPHQLDIKFNHNVQSIKWNDTSDFVKSKVVITCSDNSVYDADEVIVTVPLGVLKSESINFDPPLPHWKSSCIERMGFGLLNKVVLVYPTCFWEPDRDIFGLLNPSLSNPLSQASYSASRGRFYLFWNCLRTAGRPVLIALMAGDSAHWAESQSNDTIITEVCERLSAIFAPLQIPKPQEAIVTRWRHDPFARGSYSYVGRDTKPGDYDVMASPVGDGCLRFAGEATCGTHPATVHGAYLSGLRAASEVIENFLGPISIPTPLVPPKTPRTPSGATSTLPTGSSTKRKRAPGYIDVWEPIDKPDIFTSQVQATCASTEYEQQLILATVQALGHRPVRPAKSRANPFVLYSRYHWTAAKTHLEAQRAAAAASASASASPRSAKAKSKARKNLDRNDIRAYLGKQWRSETDAERQHYLQLAALEKQTADDAVLAAERLIAQWDVDAEKVREEFVRTHEPPVGWGGSGKRSRV